MTPPRYLNTALLLGMLCEIAAIVLVTLVVREYVDGDWAQVAARRRRDAGGVVRGRSASRPRTLGRQHAERVALSPAAPVSAITRILGPVPAAADPDRQRDHPGPRVPRGTVLDRDRAARAGRPGRGLRGDRVRRAQDDPLGLRARRHHRPRGDGAAHRRGLHRALQEPAPDDVAVPAQRLLAGAGDRREPRRRRRLRLPQGRRPARLRGARRRSSPSASRR